MTAEELRALQAEAVQAFREALEDPDLTSEEIIDAVQTALDEYWVKKSARQKRRHRQ